jgi:hypothetical protein
VIPTRYSFNNNSSPTHSYLPGSAVTSAANQSGSHSDTSSRDKVVGAIFGAIGGLLLIALATVLFSCKRRKQSRMLCAKLRLPFKLPEARWPQRRATLATSPTTHPSFNPTLLVQDVPPAPPIFQTHTQHPYTLPTPANRVSSSSAWADRPLEPQRRQESEVNLSGADKSPVLDIQRQKRSNSRGLGNSHQPHYVESVDLSSHYDDSADGNPPPAPSPPPLRRFTVRNN